MMPPSEVHSASEPRRQELFRRLNLAPGGTGLLVRMREQLLDVPQQARRPCFGRRRLRPFILVLVQPRFLVLRRIDWSTPAIVLEKIIRYEAVHEISPAGTICAAASIHRIGAASRFFHPALIDEPLIFVEVALERDIPAAIAPILAAAGWISFSPRRRGSRCSIRSRIASVGSPACPSAIS